MADIFDEIGKIDIFDEIGSKPQKGIVQRASETMKGINEAIAANVTALNPVMQAGAGLYGVGRGIAKGSLEEAGKGIKEFQDYFTYKPETETGKALANVPQKYLFEPFVERPATELGNIIGKATGSPEAGTAAYTAATLGIPAMFGMRGRPKPPKSLAEIERTGQLAPTEGEFIDSFRAKYPTEQNIIDDFRSRVPTEWENIQNYRDWYEGMPQKGPEPIPSRSEIPKKVIKPVEKEIPRSVGDQTMIEGTENIWNLQPSKGESKPFIEPERIPERLFQSRPDYERIISETELKRQASSIPEIFEGQKVNRVAIEAKMKGDIETLESEAWRYTDAKTFRKAMGEKADDPDGTWAALGFKSARDFHESVYGQSKLGHPTRPKPEKMPEPEDLIQYGFVKEESIPTTKAGQTIGELESFVKGGPISRDRPKYAEGSSINMERLSHTDDVKEFLRMQTKANEEAIGKKTVTWEETRKAAEELGWDVGDLKKAWKKKGAFSSAEITAARQLHATLLQQSFDALKSLPADPTLRTSETRLKAISLVNDYLETLKATSPASSEAGRSLNAHKMIMEANPELLGQQRFQKTLDALSKKMGVDKLGDQIIDDLSRVDWNDAKAVNDVMMKYNKPKVKDMVYEVWINAILSGPRTHARNIAGNTLAFLSKPLLETPTEVVLDTLIRRGERQAHFGEIPAEMFGAYRGIIDGVRAATRAWKTGMPSDMWNKIETGHLPSIHGKVGEIVRIPTRALLAADEFFKSAIYRAEINRQAYRIAAKETSNPTKRISRMNELIDMPTKEMMDKAHYEALYRTFNKPLGRYGRMIMSMRDQIPGLRYLVPFIRTPANIAKFTLERTPFNFAKIAHDAYMKNLPLDQLPSELAKPMVGTMIGAAIYLLAREGKITGAGPKDPAKRDAQRATGWQPYSWNIGGDYYGFNTFEPLGSIMGIAADLAEAPRLNPNDQKKLAGRLAFSITKNLASKTFLTGISGALDALSDPEQYGGDFINRYAGSLVPGIVNTMAQVTDDKVRKVESPIDAIQARIPGLSQQLPQKVVRGRALTRQEPTWARIISPSYISEKKRQ